MPPQHVSPAPQPPQSRVPPQPSGGLPHSPGWHVNGVQQMRRSQTWPGAQGVLQAPQWAGSLRMFAQVPLQQLSAPGQSTQAAPFVPQDAPLVPGRQFPLASQQPLQVVASHCSGSLTQVPFWQTWPEAQVVAAAAAVGGIGLDIGAGTAAAALLAGAIHAGDPSRAACGAARARPAVAVGVAAAVAIGRTARWRAGDTASVLADLPQLFTGVAGMVGAADEADIAAIGIGAAAARVADPVAEPVAGGTVGDTGAIGTDIGGTAVAARRAGSTERRTASGGDGTGSIQAGLVRTTAGHRGSVATQAAFVATAGAQGLAPRPRLVRRGTGGLALVPGGPGWQAIAAAGTVLGARVAPASDGENPCSR